MFEKTRKKIVVSIMTVLILLWVGTLTVIYSSSYFEMTKQNKEMLFTHTQMYSLNEISAIPPQNDDKFKPDFKHDFSQKPEFMLSTFYSVAISDEGEILKIKNDKQSVHSNDFLTTLAFELIDGKKTSGFKSNLLFQIADKGTYTLVAFMDATIFQGNISTLFRYTLIFGFFTLVVFFFLSRFLAKKIIEPLEDSYKKQKQFISDAGHELKTPISVVNANTELLQRELGEDNIWLNNIQYENERMSLLIKQLLDLARTENSELQVEEINLTQLIKGEALPFESIAFEKNLTLDFELENDVLFSGNSAQLKQLTSILVDNAISHGDDNSSIKIKLSKTNKLIIFSVINKGEAIKPSEAERIFERFYRADYSRNSDNKHYGLGLSIAKSIVESHNGKISVFCNNNFVEFKVEFHFK